jgi:hypothetical protein
VNDTRYGGVCEKTTTNTAAEEQPHPKKKEKKSRTNVRPQPRERGRVEEREKGGRATDRQELMSTVKTSPTANHMATREKRRRKKKESSPSILSPDDRNQQNLTDRTGQTQPRPTEHPPTPETKPEPSPILP